MTQSLHNRVAVVTGATRGIGRAVALALAAEGAHIVAIGRTEGALEELDDAIRAVGGAATLVPLDLTDGAGIDRLGAAIHERWGRLDILVGNAGVLGPLSPLSHVRARQWDNVVAINLTANWRLIRSLDPLLRAADHGRALFATSGAARRARPYWGPYATTKAALEMMVRTYAAETAMTELKVNLINPGPIRTGMRAEAMPGEDPMTLSPPEAIAPAFLELLSPELDRTGSIYDWPSRRWLDI